MADFCRDCTAEMWPGVDASDFPPEPGWHLCEGCGVHHFDARGRRSCRLPTPDEGEVSIDACSICIDVT